MRMIPESVRREVTEQYKNWMEKGKGGAKKADKDKGPRVREINGDQVAVTAV